MSVILATQLCHRCMSNGVRNTPSPSKVTKALLDQMLRVDHAGEFGAKRIYEGQIAVLGNTPVAPVLKHMLDQEKQHLRTFERMMPQHRVRPTVMLPIWHFAGFALGAGSAMLGKESAMACTVAVETAIGEHYDSQIRQLLADGDDGPTKHKRLIQTLSRFRDEELEHLETGLEHDAEKAPMYDVLHTAVKYGCKGAIWISERI